ncbi:MAG: DUF5103 domain-containing protein [Bacteroidales bacterium]|nr:DUF5103 domain-containing protein [Bacteroidales bacterium]
MNRHILLLFMALCVMAVSCCEGVYAQVVTDSNWREDVKTVTLYKNGVEGERPVLVLGSEDRLLLRFDVLGAEVEGYRYKIQHCDSRWQVDELEPYEYMNGFEEGPINNYNSSFTTLTDYVNYYEYIPSQYSQFLISGNYVVTVTRQDEPDSVLLTRRFCVVEGSLKADVSVGVPYDNVSIFERREVDVALKENRDYRGNMLPPTLNPAYFRVVVQQNGRTDNMRELPFGGYESGVLCYRYKNENVFEGGNTFRYFDISNIRTAMYNVVQIEEYGGEWYAMLRPLEDRSGKSFITEQTLNGGMKVNVWDRTNKQTEADYVYVNFMLPMRSPFMNGSVHVVGELTQWKLNEGSRMEYDPEMKAYRLRLLLKQGYYAYQLLFVPTGESRGLTETLEGNHYEMPNDYRVYVYYRGLNGRYDRLVAYGKN